MEFCNQQEAIARMNRWGKAQRPFLFLIDYARQHCLVEWLDRIDPDQLCYNLNGCSNYPVVPPAATPSFQWHISPISETDYYRSFQTVTDAIRAGNSYLVNLTAATTVKTDLSPEIIFQQAHATYKLWLKGQFIVFSPEIFVRIEGNRISSYPMKGTIDATEPQAARTILNDAKEAAEHATIVDLIRNDLSIIARQVEVTRYRYIDRIETHRGPLLQVSSEVSGQLPSDWRTSLGTLFFSLLPAGSITGAPKRKTLQIIADAETYDRGFYTGVMGYFDGENLDSAVMIRFMEEQRDSFIFKSGGGITAKSDCRREYEELIKKVYVPIY
ncbi:MAG: aminodeoxychorismate synthase component I [Parabacteroides sp.]